MLDLISIGQDRVGCFAGVVRNVLQYGFPEGNVGVYFDESNQRSMM